MANSMDALRWRKISDLQKNHNRRIHFTAELANHLAKHTKAPLGSNQLGAGNITETEQNANHLKHCEKEVETVEHLFINCEVARAMWEDLFRWLNIEVANFRDPSGLFNMVDSLKISLIKKQVIHAVVATGVWFLWKY